MEKMVPGNRKKANRTPKNKQKQPIKVVYITNPVKFEASPSEFRALVQELTGQDSNTPDSAAYSVDAGGGEAVKVAADGNVHAVEEEVTKMEHPSKGEMRQEGSDPPAVGSYDDDFGSPQMVENFQGLVDSDIVDVLKRF